MRKVIAAAVIIGFIACSGKMPKNIIPVNEMKKIVYDLAQADEYLNNFLNKDTTIDIRKRRSILYEQVFKLHNTSRTIFYTSYKFYQQRPDLQKELFDSVTAEVNKKAPAKIERKPIKVDKAVKPVHKIL